MAVLLVFPSGAQQGPVLPHEPQQSRPEPMNPITGSSSADYPGGYSIDEERQLRALNAERQKSMVSDTMKLLKLANELEAEVSGANLDSLTPAQLRKVSEIEKLARNVKEKMSISVRGAPAFQQPPVPMIR